MKESKAHKLSLALPLMVPVFLTLLLSLDLRLPEWLTRFAVLTIYSGLVGGIPYLVLVALLLWWGHAKSDTQFKRALALSPILMLPFFLLFLLLIGLILGGNDRFEVTEFVRTMILYFSFILGFGYSYVLLVLSTVFVLKRLGVVVPSPAIKQSVAAGHDVLFLK
jgi:hypothetical protein